MWEEEAWKLLEASIIYYQGRPIGKMDCFAPGPGLMPASFKVEHDGEREFLVADFGEQAIARVPPVDSCPRGFCY